MAKFNSNEDDEQGLPRPSRRYRSGNIPWIHEPRCTVCRSQYRSQVDKLLVAGFSLASVAEYFERLGETFTRNSLSRHKNRHMTLHSAAIRRIVEQRAEEIVDNVEEHAGFLASKRAILEVAVQKGYDMITSGKVPMTPQDLLAFMEKLERLESEEQAHAIDEMIRDFKAFSQAVKMLVPEDVWPQIVQQYKFNLEASKTPVLEELIQIGPAQTLEDITDAEIEEDE